MYKDLLFGKEFELGGKPVGDGEPSRNKDTETKIVKVLFGSSSTEKGVEQEVGEVGLAVLVGGQEVDVERAGQVDGRVAGVSRGVAQGVLMHFLGLGQVVVALEVVEDRLLEGVQGLL